MAQINGSFSLYSTSIFKPYMVWSVASQDIPNNQSTISWTLYFAKYNGAYYAYNTSFSPCVISVNGTVFSGSESFDLRSGSVPEIEAIRSGSRVVTHNADGTKSIYIGASGDTGGGVLGTYNFGQTVALPTIPRQATITSSSNLTIEDDLPYTLNNAGSLYVRLEFWINGNAGWYKVADSQRGTGSSGTLTLTSTDDDEMYSRMPNVTSASCKLRAYTYSDSGYSTQVGSYDDQDGTVSVDQTANKPTFSDYTIATVDKTVDVEDKYSNSLVSSSTDTLRGSDTDAIIEGYDKVRATILSANKMVAQNYATENKYRLIGNGYAEENYIAGDLTIDLDNQDQLDFDLTAYDSRALTTTVEKSITTLISYEDVSLWGLAITRDNSVDTTVNLVISGSYTDGDFGVGGVTNTQTAHYRYKETTETWGVQTWNSLTLTDTSGSLSYDGAINGDLGADGFDSSKSYDIEVRVYDKLSATIVEATLDKGEPIMDVTAEGVAFGNLYDSTEGGEAQVNERSIYGLHEENYKNSPSPKITNPFLQNSWVDYQFFLYSTQPQYGCAGYYCDPFGFVHLEGLVKSGTTGSGNEIFTVPREFAPPRKILHHSMSSGTTNTRMDIYGYSGETGTVNPTTGSNTWWTLDQVRYPTFKRGWEVPTFESSWVNYASRSTATASTYMPCAYMKDDLGFVHLTGMVKNGTVGHGSPIFTLPSGYRPAGDLIFTTISNSAFSRVHVHSDGTVDCHVGNNNWVSLEGIYFMAEDSPNWQKFSSMTLDADFSDTGVGSGSYLGAMEWISPDGVYHIMGAVDNDGDVTGVQQIATSPSEVQTGANNYYTMFRCSTSPDSGSSHLLRVDHLPDTGEIRAQTDYTGIENFWTSLSGNRVRLL